MSGPRVIVMRAAGTNCERETVHAFELAGAGVETVHVNEFSRGLRRLDEFQLLCIAGGFTYGDDVSAGRIFANEIRMRLGDQVREFVAAGKLVLGICNGFQVLAKAGLLPGRITADQPQEAGVTSPGSEGSRGGGLPAQQATLAENANGRFQCRWVRLKIRAAASPPFLAGMDGEVIEVPIAHGEGRFDAPPEVLDELGSRGLVAFEYCGPGGELSEEYNVNGSALHAAGISGFDGHVLGLMPHPERHVHGTQHPRWTREGLKPEGQGLRIFRSAVDYLRQA